MQANESDDDAQLSDPADFEVDAEGDLRIQNAGEYAPGKPTAVRLDLLEYHPDEIAEVELELPSALFERILLEIEETEHETVAEFIESSIGVHLGHFDARHSGCRMVDVEIPEALWERIRLKAALTAQTGRGRGEHSPYWDAVHEFLQVTPNLVVDGEVVGPEDIPGLDGPDE